MFSCEIFANMKILMFHTNLRGRCNGINSLSTILYCFITYIMNIVCIGKNNLVEISKHSRYKVDTEIILLK